WSRESRRLPSGFDVFCGPAPEGGPSPVILVWLLVVGVLAFALAAIAARMDWDFLLLKLGVLVVWLLTFSLIYRASSGYGPVTVRGVALVCALPLVGHYGETSLQARLPQWLGTPGTTIRHTLDRYVVYNAAFRLAEEALQDRSEDTPIFDRFVRANT